jgi:hypothetical protein
VKRLQWRAIAILLAAGIAGSVLAAGCAKKDVKQEVVATVNGEDIRVVDLREFLGAPAGVFAVTNVPVEKKKEALDRLVASRILSQVGRSRGLDNTAQFKEIYRQNEQGALISALLRKEIEAKVKLDDDDKEVKAEAARLKEAKPAPSDADASAQARKTIAEARIRKLQEELVATAKKESGATVDQAMIDRIGKGEALPDNAVLAAAGDEKVLYGDVRKTLQGMTQGGGPGMQQDLSKNPSAIGNVVNRDLVGKALAAYARKQGVEKSDGFKAARQDLERNILIGMVADNVVSKDMPVSDKEIETVYKDHSAEMVRGGKKIPLSAVKEQIRAFLKNEKRRKALEEYLAEQKQKAKITVDDAVLAKA